MPEKIKTFVVNMERDTIKRSQITSQLSLYPFLDAVIVKAVDGRLLSEHEVAQLSTLGFRRRYYGTRAALGCALSHYSIYQALVREKIRWAFVLEDDAILSPHIDIIKNCVDLLSTDQPIVILLTPEFKYRQNKARVLQGNFKVTRAVDAMMTSGYLINLEAAALLCRLVFPVNRVADDWTFFCKKGLSLYGIVPHLVSYPNSFGEIGHAHQNKLSHRHPLMRLRACLGKGKAFFYNVYFKVLDYVPSEKQW